VVPGSDPGSSKFLVSLDSLGTERCRQHDRQQHDPVGGIACMEPGRSGVCGFQRPNVTAGGPVASWLQARKLPPASARSFTSATIKNHRTLTIRTFALSVSQNFEYCAFGTGSCFRAPKRVQCTHEKCVIGHL
jgi:hypothetical protein